MLILKKFFKDRLKEFVKYTNDFSAPAHVFKVKYSEEKERKFESLKQQSAEALDKSDSVTSMSFHGTRMDNVYSILHTGLLAHLNKVVSLN